MNIPEARELLGVSESASLDEIQTAQSAIWERARKAKDSLLWHNGAAAGAALMIEAGHMTTDGELYIQRMDSFYNERIVNATWLDRLGSSIGSLIEVVTGRR